MPLLRLTQHIENEDQYRIGIAFEDDDGSRQTADVSFPYQFTKEDRADMRWYLEDYLQYPRDPAPEIAARVEKRMSALGIELFQKVLQGDDDARDLWATLRHKLDNTRVEINTDVQGANALPWELLRDPKTDTPMALRARAFIRSYTKAAQKADKPVQADKVRILLVICRPRGDEDVPFRSVASKLIKGLDEKTQESFKLDVLRPPTFEQLSKVLHEAKARGEPYHIVHFDGHGAYLQSDKGILDQILEQLGALVFTTPREGTHGYLLFENSKAKKNAELVDGTSLGKLLADTDTPVLVLNACRSAHADIQEKPEAVEDAHSQVRAFGSLAQEVMDAGVAGVVAMRYNVYVVTAAQFVADLYAALAAGQSLGEAVSLGRKQLAAQPLREIAFAPRPLQDWSVPVVYEAAPISLFPKPVSAASAPLHIDITQSARPADDLPRPDVGFYGRDETLLALDRAFDTQKVVLLHAYAGSGKTMTAAEFARWYSQTGGLSPHHWGEAGGGQILFTSFEQYKPLERVLDTIGQVFGPTLEASGIQWSALSDEERLNVTAQVLKQIPVLWIWDNVEPVSGFPAGANSAWSEAEQRDLKNFLGNMSAQTRARFLLTSRREERAWLGDLPARINLPPMPMQERVQLARALAEKQGQKLTAVDDWLPLLRYTLGNPLTLTVVVGQALRLVAKIVEADPQKQKTRRAAKLNAYLEQLYTGEAAFEDEASEGRTKSLGASLSYGFETAFSEDERKILALLHFFQGFVDVDVLKAMVADEDWGIGSKDFTRQAGIALLDKAAEIGLLSAHGGGYYTIHPALPWFFRTLFEQYYPAETVDPSTSLRTGGRPLTEAEQTPSIVLDPPSMRATRAYVESMGALGDYYHNQYGAGDREVIAPLRREEANLLHARALALSGLRGSKGDVDWSDPLTSAMQGLQTLYDHTGRRAEWKRLVEEIAPDFVGPDDLPLPGREAQWSLVTEYRVRLAGEERGWAEAERLQHKRVEWNRREAAPLLGRSPDSLSANEKNTLRTLAVSAGQLGQILRDQGKPECVQALTEQYEVNLKIGNTTGAAIAAFNLGHAYKDLPALRDLDEAGRWYRRSLELQEDGDRKGRAITVGQLGSVAYERFNDAKKEGKTKEELSEHLNSAAGYYRQALALLPPDGVNDLAVVHNQLGIIYKNAGDLERALYHYNEAIRYQESADNFYAAGQTRFNVAVTIANKSRLHDALLYARAALRNFESYGGRAKEDEEDTKRLIAEIEKAMKEQ